MWRELLVNIIGLKHLETEQTLRTVTQTTITKTYGYITRDSITK